MPEKLETFWPVTIQLTVIKQRVSQRGTDPMASSKSMDPDRFMGEK